MRVESVLQLREAAQVIAAVGVIWYSTGSRGGDTE